MIEDAIWNVVNVKVFEISEDHPIVRAYIELCREDPVFSAETNFYFLNGINKFVVKKNDISLVILHEDNEEFDISVWDPETSSWVYDTVSKDRIKEELKSLYYYYGQFV